MLTKSNPERAKQLLKQAQAGIDQRWRFYENLAQLGSGGNGKDRSDGQPAADTAAQSTEAK